MAPPLARSLWPMTGSSSLIWPVICILSALAAALICRLRCSKETPAACGAHLISAGQGVAAALLALSICWPWLPYAYRLARWPCSSFMRHMGHNIHERLLVWVLCAPLGAYYLTCGLALNLNTTWWQPKISNSEWLLALGMFFMLGRESCKLQVLPWMASMQASLQHSQALLSDLLPEHVVQQLVRSASSTSALSPAPSASLPSQWYPAAPCGPLGMSSPTTAPTVRGTSTSGGGSGTNGFPRSAFACAGGSMAACPAGSSDALPVLRSALSCTTAPQACSSGLPASTFAAYAAASASTSGCFAKPTPPNSLGLGLSVADLLTSPVMSSPRLRLSSPGLMGAGSGSLGSSPAPWGSFQPTPAGSCLEFSATASNSDSQGGASGADEDSVGASNGGSKACMDSVQQQQQQQLQGQQQQGPGLYQQQQVQGQHPVKARVGGSFSMSGTVGFRSEVTIGDGLPMRLYRTASAGQQAICAAVAAVLAPVAVHANYMGSTHSSLMDTLGATTATHVCPVTSKDFGSVDANAACDEWACAVRAASIDGAPGITASAFAFASAANTSGPASTAAQGRDSRDGTDATAPDPKQRQSPFVRALSTARSNFQKLLSPPALKNPGVSDGLGMGLEQDPAALPKVAEQHACCTIFFSDIVNFSSWAHKLPPALVMDTLNQLYSLFDDLILQEFPSLYKIETVGDAYMVASNVLCDSPQHAADTLRFALRAQQAASQVLRPDRSDGSTLQLRVGLHSGPAVSGIVGKLRRRFCMFGDTVNLASRTETSCPLGAVQLTSATYTLAVPYLSQDEVNFFDRGGIRVKGADDPLHMYLAFPGSAQISAQELSDLLGTVAEGAEGGASAACSPAGNTSVCAHAAAAASAAATAWRTEAPATDAAATAWRTEAPAADAAAAISAPRVPEAPEAVEAVAGIASDMAVNRRMSGARPNVGTASLPDTGSQPEAMTEGASRQLCAFPTLFLPATRLPALPTSEFGVGLADVTEADSEEHSSAYSHTLSFDVSSRSADRRQELDTDSTDHQRWLETGRGSADHRQALEADSASDSASADHQPSYWQALMTDSTDHQRLLEAGRGSTDQQQALDADSASDEWQHEHDLSTSILHDRQSLESGANLGHSTSSPLPLLEAACQPSEASMMVGDAAVEVPALSSCELEPEDAGRKAGAMQGGGHTFPHFPHCVDDALGAGAAADLVLSPARQTRRRRMAGASDDGHSFKTHHSIGFADLLTLPTRPSYPPRNAPRGSGRGVVAPRPTSFEGMVWKGSDDRTPC